MEHKFDEETLVLHLSDIHYGEIVDLPENQYNTDIAEQRIEKCFDKVILFGNDVLGHTIPFKELFIFITGDCCHNETMRGSAKMNAECNFIEQVIGVSDCLAFHIHRLKSLMPQIEKINVFGVRGNHGRIGPPGENDPNASIDNQVYDRLKLLMKDEPSVTVENTRYPYAWVEIMGWGFVAEHGDTVRCQMGIPFYGLNRLRDRRYKNLTGKMDFLLVGHFHQRYHQTDGSVEVLMCPSLVGLNDYAISFGGGHIVEQMLYTVHPEHGITGYYPLRCG